jgi:biopolymer transport protein ExbB
MTHRSTGPFFFALALSAGLFGPVAAFEETREAGPPAAPPTARPAAPPVAPPAPGPQAAPAPATPGPSDAGYRHPETYLEFAIAGGPVMIPIGLASLFALAFLLERLWSTRRARVVPPRLVAALGAGGAAGGIPPAQVDALLLANPSAASRVLKAALGRLGRPRAEIEAAVNTAAQREVVTLRRNVRLFAVLSTVTPLLGLLGTVTGLIRAFRQVAMQGLGQGQAYAAGIYEALTNTAAGLIVAIPCLLAYYWLMGRVDRYVHQMDELVVGLVDGRAAGGPS